MPSNTTTVICGVCLRRFNAAKALSQHKRSTLCGSKVMDCDPRKNTFDGPTFTVIEQAIRK